MVSYLVAYISISFIALFFFKRRYTKITKGANSINLDTIRELSFNDIMWVDVRSYRETEASSFSECEKVPLDEIKKLNAGKEQKIILFCNSGIRASKAAEILRAEGYIDVCYFAGNHKTLQDSFFKSK